MRYFLTLCLALGLTAGYAQQKPKVQQVFYFKNNGLKLPTADSADYIRIVTLPDSGSTLFGISDYYPNNKVKMLGKSISIDPPRLEGQSISYSPTGKRQSVLTYDNGMLTGTNYLFHANGKPYITFTVDTGQTLGLDERMRIMSCSDTAGKALVIDGNGHFVSYDENYRYISEEGDIKGGKRVGEWHGTYPAEKVTYTDTYQDGKFISGVTTAANGVKYTYNSKSQTPEYPGGATAFTTLVKKKVKLPAALKTKPVQIFASFTITKDGKVTNPILLGTITPEVDKAIIDGINASAAWKPRIQNGLPVDTSWGLPIAFNTPAAPAKGAAKK
ncbi:hypothetical protein LLH06_03565 [Mucilaginibacter daejeonensis]|uniref:hypothetical protein n=1 Tax=Mucilaginibacter daejeonensis TaxID=398049 RepID=UPI001D174B92|nr:hypothetical protein [Mucilaginibacter daejeonensis]UEG54047.1 hypothetical protein LLH06_03565 [Mucilaginibacter daejeonensis]